MIVHGVEIEFSYPITESKYLTKLWLEHVDGNNWIVCAPLIYQSKLLNGIVVVPTGSDTDLASIPWIFRLILPKSGKYNPDAVLHDSGYRGNLENRMRVKINLIKELCDKLFLEAMEVSGVGEKTRNIMYKAVDIFSTKKGG